MDFMISSHGFRSENTPLITLPENITVKFFVEDGDSLTNNPYKNSNAWGLFNHLLPGMALEGNREYVNSRVIQTVSPGEDVHNYSCKNMADLGLQDYSGVYVVGGERVDELPNELTLEEVIGLINAKKPTIIYWVACRDIV